MRVRFSPLYIVIFLAVCLFLLGACILVYNLPPVHDRLAVHIDTWRARIKYALNPPEDVVFVPQESTGLQETLAARDFAPTPTVMLPDAPTSTPVPPTSENPMPTLIPSPTPTPLPEMVRLPGVKYEDQHNRWNYCGPANLSMAMTFWGWEGDRDVVGAYVKPSTKDKNVMPYEMEDFVETQTTNLAAVVRSGGEISLVKSLLAAGFPVLAEKGYYEYDYNGKLGWMGHYQFITGYDDAQGVLIVQDTYNDGPDFEVSYADFTQGWRSFNYVFLVIYPLEYEDTVLLSLGSWADADWASRHALEVAQQEAAQLTGIDEFFAWYNAGTSHVSLREYTDASIAYDYAFSLYAGLGDDEMRPYRMLWYQTGPYFAYYYTYRFYDLISLANTTLYDTISEPVLEESLYWRGMAKLGLGETEGAVEDFRDSLQWHPGFAPSVDQLQQLGLEP